MAKHLAYICSYVGNFTNPRQRLTHPKILCYSRNIYSDRTVLGKAWNKIEDFMILKVVKIDLRVNLHGGKLALEFSKS